MKVLILPLLILAVGCGSSPDRVTSADSQETSPDLVKLLDLANKVVELQRKAQPISWNVSEEESYAKENPFTPPEFTLNSGVPPKQIANPYPSDSGLWNCPRLKAGSTHCQDIEARKHMIALHYPETTNSQGGGKVAAFNIRSTLVADCNVSDGVEITITSPFIRNVDNKVSELSIGFDNEPFVNYKMTSLNEWDSAFTNPKLLLAKLMEDFTTVKVRTLSTENASVNTLEFTVKNFPKAWAVACGWYSEYDVATGVR